MLDVAKFKEMTKTNIIVIKTTQKMIFIRNKRHKMKHEYGAKVWFFTLCIKGNQKSIKNHISFKYVITGYQKQHRK